MFTPSKTRKFSKKKRNSFELEEQQLEFSSPTISFFYWINRYWVYDHLILSYKFCKPFFSSFSFVTFTISKILAYCFQLINFFKKKSLRISSDFWIFQVRSFYWGILFSIKPLLNKLTIPSIFLRRCLRLDWDWMWYIAWNHRCSWGVSSSFDGC